MEGIGYKLKELREKNNYSLRYVGEQLGIDYSYLGKLEKGNGKNPSLPMLKQIADFFGVKMSYFLEEEDAIDLMEILNNSDLKWGDQELTDEEKQRALEMMRILLNK